MFKVTFFGAAREVTGSMHLLEADGKLVALDCGMFQGKRQESEEKNRSFPIDPSKLHAVVLSHAHMDHSGRLPKLVREGFNGRIFSTGATRDLSALLLSDSAHIQQEDARYVNKKRARQGQPPIMPMYDDDDVARTMGLFETVPHGRDFWVTKRLKVRYQQVGHMLGAGCVFLEYTPETGPPVRLLFTGDVGRFDVGILNDPKPFPQPDYFISESTYGGRVHPAMTGALDAFADLLIRTYGRGGKVIIPAFSIGRTQQVVYGLHRLSLEDRMPKMPIYVDSPLATNATEVFRLHPELLDKPVREMMDRTGDVWGQDFCTYVHTAEESKSLNTRREPCVIISASGMCENGRIVHHLRNNIENPKNTIAIVGYQAAHTLGRRLVEKQPTVMIFGETLQVRAEIQVFNGMSGHADREELRKLNMPIARGVKHAFLVHGEVDQMEKMRDTMRQDGYAKVDMPAAGESFILNGNALPA